MRKSTQSALRKGEGMQCLGILVHFPDGETDLALCRVLPGGWIF